MFYNEERSILASGSSPWLVSLQYAFQDSRYLYLVMQYMPGGDLLSVIEKREELSNEEVRFYLAELALALHALHTLGYAHR